ncbi:nucleic acid/nucleotide deaminase domain-containing protein [Streptomyces sp. NPDC016845]|uniref:nucleic acid/nucleotide deaminase domain-containing protein n=1 Tax=Streptomyces sp. NPDC016845 TaxID=3364972 RepID=UPI00379BFC66
MGYTIPGWLDDVLDFIGINFPNVDEDDYREMATAMRDFADKFEGHGADAHKAFSRILSSSEGWAVDSMEKHWSQVKGSHLEKLPELARLFADACDVLADIIFAMKTKAEIELAVMAGSVGISAGLAVVTGGLSALIGAAEVAAMRGVVKRIIDEAVDRIVDEVIAKVTEPVNAKMEAMVEDMVLDLAEGAFSMQNGDGAGGGRGGHGGMQLASASGVGGNGAKVTRIDHFEFEEGAGKVSAAGGELRLNAAAHLTKAKSAFGRSKSRDPFTQAFDSVLHGALKGADKALKKIAKHVTETVPDRVKAASKTHKRKDHDVRDDVNRIDAKRQKTDPEVRMYLLNADGSVHNLHPDGTTSPVKANDNSGIRNIMEPDGTVWRPKPREKHPWGVPRGYKGAKAQSRKIQPGSTDLSRATEIARFAKGDYRGTNFAAARYIDPESQQEIILVGDSEGPHSERTIGYPLLRHGRQHGLTELYTEREPCQLSPRCDAWLKLHFSDDIQVTHANDYDQTVKGHSRDAEHRKYMSDLERRHKAQGHP